MPELNNVKYIEIMDTTLRDGEQMKGVSYSKQEKLSLAKMLLEEVNVDRIEITSARVSEGEKESSKLIIQWAKSKNRLQQIEILGYVDINKSVDWLKEVGCNVMNLLAKGSLNHLTHQLRKTKEEHVSDILKTLDYATKNGISINIYLEDWSNGIKSSKDYVYYLIETLKTTNIKRFMLPDTLGILYPSETKVFISSLTNDFPNLHFDFHAHNDYGLACSNTLSAIEGGVSGVHVTVNGMGERAGNVSIDEVVAGMNDFSQINAKNKINEKMINKISKEVEIFSGFRISFNKPILGSNVYTQTAGIHADGDLKANLYANPLLPERFGRERTYALGKLSGMASLEKNLNNLDIDLSEEEKKKVLQRIIELGDKKESITEEDLPYIISDILETPISKPFKIKSCVVITNKNLKPMATVLVEYQEKEIQEISSGDGGYDAFMKAIKKIADHFNLTLPKLENYYVIIPPGGKTDALVQTTITWSNGVTFKTKGVDSDQLLSAVEATEKMINIVVSNITKGK
ncbi:MAG: 2-isopropylmalate synthase [Spirochaetota bacterium]|nr:2-isopropylmalate synthase [Spirochaetota bacterium]